MSFRELQRRYDNQLPPSYYAPDEPDEEEYPVCYYCGKEIKDGMYIGSPRVKIECDECIGRRHEKVCEVSDGI